MASKEQILAWLDKVIATLTVVVSIIPGKIDDLALSFLIWASEDETFLGWLDRFEPPAENAMTAPPEALIHALRRWGADTGNAEAASSPGDFMELIGYLLAVFQWIQKRKGTPVPAA